MLNDFTNQTGLSFIRRDRAELRRGGGIAICYRSEKIQFSRAKIPPSKHEVLAAVGRRQGQRRKIVVINVYIPPWYNAQQNRSLLSYTNDVVLALKNKYENPYIVMGGDFNKRDFKAAVQEHPEIKPIKTGPTRNNAVLDILGTNFNELLLDSGTVDPIWSQEGVESDHRTLFNKFRMPRVPSYTVQNYSYFHQTEESHKKMGQWLRTVDWSPINGATSTEAAVEFLHSKFSQGQRECYEEKTRKKKSSEPVWMADWIRDLIEDRRKIFQTDRGRSERWKVVKKRTSKIITKRKKKCDQFILEKFRRENNPGKLFHHVDCLLGNNTKPRWSPTEMFPEKTPLETAEEMASFFNSISQQYEPLNQEDIPFTFPRSLPTLTVNQVKDQIKKQKKPKSTVDGDLPPQLWDLYPDVLAPPVTDLFNMITEKKSWPGQWKLEYVTIIPKITNPQHPNECRNISCTNYLSKLYESFVLEWCRQEVKPKNNQYGGEKGSSATHLMIEVMDDLTSALEDNRAGVILSAIDFSKAFNRLDHLKCLEAFAEKGASSETLQLLGSFLSSRRMVVRVEGKKSNPRPVNAGAPQGSVLGLSLIHI